MTDIVTFFYENTFMVIMVVMLVLLFFYRRPKVFLTLFLFVFLIALTAYLILNISDTAVANKKEMIQHSQYTLF